MSQGAVPETEGAPPAIPVVDPAMPEPGTRRHATARGVVINSAFQIGLGTLNLLRALVGAAYLSAADYGIWSILILAVALFAGLRAVMVGDKFIQQSETDQEAAFQKAFTLELMSSGIMFVLAVAAAPLLGLLYGRPELMPPMMVLALVLPSIALQAPIWVYYRRMDFLRQRLLLSVDPIVAFAVTVALLIGGFGYWALIVGALVGCLSGGIVALIANPYPFAFRYDAGTMRTYLSFSWPLVLAILSALTIAQLSVLAGTVAVGLGAAGAIGLASGFSMYTNRIDQVITQALYPAICRVRDRQELLFEAFVKSNRLALMWGMPFGVGLSLFATDLVDFVIGDQWMEAVVLIQVFGLAAAAGHIGFNWNAFYRATGNTRPEAVIAATTFVTFLAAPLPLIFIAGLDGFAAGIGIMTAVMLVVRFHYLVRLFPKLKIFRHMFRAIAPTVPAVLVVIALRALETGERDAATAALELVSYLLVTALATWLAERALLREAFSYVRSPTPATGLLGGG